MSRENAGNQTLEHHANYCFMRGWAQMNLSSWRLDNSLQTRTDKYTVA